MRLAILHSLSIGERTPSITAMMQSSETILHLVVRLLLLYNIFRSLVQHVICLLGGL